ncbi:MAG TPA: hypothetical protein VF604_06055 [Pyrinomonadaceae bacterium]
MNSGFPRTSLPPLLAQMISGYTRRQNHTGFSPSRVFRLDAQNQKQRKQTRRQLVNKIRLQVSQ